MAAYPHQMKRSGPKPGARTGGSGRHGRVNHNAGVNRALKSIRQAEAKARQAEYDNLLPEQKIARLDKLFGKGLGAKRERARIAKSLKKAA